MSNIEIQPVHHQNKQLIRQFGEFAQRTTTFTQLWQKQADQLSFPVSERLNIHVLAARVDENIIGALSFREAGDSIKVDHLEVEKSKRRQGAGTALMKEVILLGKPIELETQDEATKKFFEKIGGEVKYTSKALGQKRYVITFN